MVQAEFRRTDGTIVAVSIKRQGRNNSRVVFDNGHEELIPNDMLVVVSSAPNSKMVGIADSHRMVPQTALRRFYRELRSLHGTRHELFKKLLLRLAPPHGPQDADFLAELFARSQAAMEFYRNPDSPFYQRGRRSAPRDANPDARLLVNLISDGAVTFNSGCRRFEYVDYEICPTQTTLSCLENGKPATSSGGGGMDLLLLSTESESPSTNSEPLPVVGEIKAATEYVGPTFALVQTLAYAAELVTESQWSRLGHAFNRLQTVCTADRRPQLDILLLLQLSTNREQQASGDLEFAKRLSQQLISDCKVSHAIRRIEFISWQLHGERAILSPA